MKRENLSNERIPLLVLLNLLHLKFSNVAQFISGLFEDSARTIFHDTLSELIYGHWGVLSIKWPLENIYSVVRKCPPFLENEKKFEQNTIAIGLVVNMIFTMPLFMLPTNSPMVFLH